MDVFDPCGWAEIADIDAPGISRGGRNVFYDTFSGLRLFDHPRLVIGRCRNAR